MFVFLAIVGGGAGLYLAVCAIAAFGYLHPPKLAGPMPKEFAAQDWQQIQLASTPVLAANLDLKDSEIGFVLLHGWGGGQSTWAGLGQFLASKGYSVVIPALPGHAPNKAGITTFGVRESDIAIQLASELRKRGCKRVIGIGVSMGGSTLWLASEKDPSTFDGIVSEGAFATLSEAIPTWNAGRFPFGDVVLAPAATFAEKMSGIEVAKIRPVDGAGVFRGRPAIVLSCEFDSLVPLSNAKKLAEAAGVDVQMIPGSKHAEGYVTDPAAYERIVMNLVEQVK